MCLKTDLCIVVCVEQSSHFNLNQTGFVKLQPYYYCQPVYFLGSPLGWYGHLEAAKQV